MKAHSLAAVLFSAFTLAAQTPAAPPVRPDPPAPAFTAEQKNTLYEAQHKLDATEKQLSALDSQFQKLQSQAVSQYTALQAEQKKETDALEAAKTAALKAVNLDPAKWTVDPETMSPTAAAPVKSNVPPPQAPVPYAKEAPKK